MEIRLGDWDLASPQDCQEERCSPPHLRVHLERALVHPMYARRFPYSDDIALIRLNETLDLEELSRE